MNEFYTRRLPHWQPADKWIFLTCCLAGSLPPIPELPTRGLTAGERFVFLDGEVDKAATGPVWLTDSRIAEIVQKELIANDGALYDLGAWVIMPNHVHFMLLPQVALQEINRDHRLCCQPGAWSHRPFLARRVLRSLDPLGRGMEPRHWLH